MVTCKAANPGESYEFLHSGNLKISKILDLNKDLSSILLSNKHVN